MTGQSEEMVLVPRNPTKEMIDSAWAYALDEDAGAVWKEMIRAYEALEEKREG